MESDVSQDEKIDNHIFEYLREREFLLICQVSPYEVTLINHLLKYVLVFFYRFSLKQFIQFITKYQVIMSKMVEENRPKEREFSSHDLRIIQEGASNQDPSPQTTRFKLKGMLILQMDTLLMNLTTITILLTLTILWITKDTINFN